MYTNTRVRHLLLIALPLVASAAVVIVGCGGGGGGAEQDLSADAGLDSTAGTGGMGGSSEIGGGGGAGGSSDAAGGSGARAGAAGGEPEPVTWANFTAHRDTEHVRGSAVLHLQPTGTAALPAESFADLDYSGDFSVEAAVMIEPYSSGGRWAKIVSKTLTLWDATSGFGLGFDQGQFANFGQALYAKVGDGANGITVVSNRLHGLVHATMTWNAAARELSLYANGKLAGASSNPSFDLEGLINTDAFEMGAGGYATLQRDILFVRTWNRLLTEDEVQAISSWFDETGRHTVPAGVERTGLHGEWRMEQTCDATGAPGSSHVLDSEGSNHLALSGSASVLQGEGELRLEVPADGAVGVPKAAFLEASGGTASLGASAALPLHYQFEVDESPTFDSAARRVSGWIPHYGLWRPVLKPSTQYYVRVRVRDSSDPAQVSDMTAARGFTTKDVASWYVRPGVYTGQIAQNYDPVPESGIYGVQDGRSHANAWNGLRSIVWGPHGVEAGDDLYVCGTHVFEISDGDFFGQKGSENIQESGLSDEQPITVRMDCPDGPGTVWGTFWDRRVDPVWSGPDANGVYWTSDLGYGAAAEKVGNDYVFLDWEQAPTWVGHPGATYRENGVTYVKTTDGSSPAGRILSPTWGYQFSLGRSRFVRFYQARLYHSVLGKEGWNETDTALPTASHITFERCDLRYAGTLIPLSKGHDDWTVRNSELSMAENGIYTVTYQVDRGADRLTVEHCQIHDIGRPHFPGGDEHAIGVQGGEGHLFQYNEIWKTGSAIEFWTWDVPMKNMTVRYNYIHDVHVSSVTGGGGIGCSGDNVASAPGLRTGFEIYGNIVHNTGLGLTEGWQGNGIGSNNKDYIRIYNNIVMETPSCYGVGMTVINNEAQGLIERNIVVNAHPEDRSIWVVGDATTNVSIDSNLLYSSEGATPDVFIYPADVEDTNTLVADPMFARFPPQTLDDFELQADSPAWQLGFERIPIELIGPE